MKPFLSLLAALFLLVLAPVARADMALVMAEETGCPWCLRWHAEIGPIYPKTPEGQAAPLRRIDIHADLPADIVLKQGLHFSPTFVLIRDGRELARIEGYPGEDFFWAMLSKMLQSAQTPTETGG